MPSAALVSFDQAPAREGILALQTNDCQFRALGQKTQARRWAWDLGDACGKTKQGRKTQLRVFSLYLLVKHCAMQILR